MSGDGLSRGVIVRCVVLFGLLGLFQSTLGPLIPVVRDDNGISNGTAGLLVSGFFAGSLASTAIGGALPERWARRYLVVAPVLLVVVGCAGVALRGPWPLPLVAVIVTGLGFGSLTLVVNTAMASQPGRRGVLLVNLVNGVFGLGATAGPALLGLTRNLGYSLVFVALAVAVVLTLPPRDLGSTARVDDHLPARRTTNPVLLILFGALLLSYTGLETGLSSWESVHLEAHGYAPATASALTSLFWLGLAAGRLVIPLVTAKWRPPRIIVTTLVGALVALVLVGARDAAPVGYFLAGFLAGPVLPTALAWNAASQPNPRRANAIVITAAMVGNVTLPAAIGYTMQATSDLTLPALVAVPVLTCLTLATLIHRRTRDSVLGRVG